MVRHLNRCTSPCDTSGGPAGRFQRLPRSGSRGCTRYPPPPGSLGGLALHELRCDRLDQRLPAVLQGKSDVPTGCPCAANRRAGKEVQPCPHQPDGAASSGRGRVYISPHHGGPDNSLVGRCTSPLYGGRRLCQSLHRNVGGTLWPVLRIRDPE